MKKNYVLLIALFALFCAGKAFSQDIYLSAVGVGNAPGAAPATSGTLTTGAGLDKGFTNYSKITSFQYGFSNSSSISTTAGGGPGRTQLNEITITKNVDQASNRLMQAGLSSIRLSSAQILIVSNTGDASARTVYKIDLKNAYITEFNASAGGGCPSGGCVGESFKIIYSAIQVTTYTQNTTTGVITANPPASWSQTGNSPEF